MVVLWNFGVILGKMWNLCYAVIESYLPQSIYAKHQFALAQISTLLAVSLNYFKKDINVRLF